MGERRFSWGHITIYVSDLEASIAFYELLGFNVFLPAIPYLGIERGADDSMTAGLRSAYRIASQAPMRGCIMQLDAGFPKIDIICGAQNDAVPSPTDPGMGRLCLLTEDLHGEVTRLRAAGVAFEAESVAGVGSLADVAICADPDGTSIELLQVHLDRWAPYLAARSPG